MGRFHYCRNFFHEAMVYYGLKRTSRWLAIFILKRQWTAATTSSRFGPELVHKPNDKKTAIFSDPNIQKHIIQFISQNVRSTYGN